MPRARLILCWLYGAASLLALVGTWRQNVPAPGARNVAALASNNHIFAVVRAPAAGVTDTTLCTQFGIRGTGCVAVFGHK